MHANIDVVTEETNETTAAMEVKNVTIWWIYVLSNQSKFKKTKKIRPFILFSDYANSFT